VTLPASSNPTKPPTAAVEDAWLFTWSWTPRFSIVPVEAPKSPTVASLASVMTSAVISWPWPLKMPEKLLNPFPPMGTQVV
jgi:hypothetical protein